MFVTARHSAGLVGNDISAAKPFYAEVSASR